MPVKKIHFLLILLFSISIYMTSCSGTKEVADVQEHTEERTEETITETRIESPFPEYESVPAGEFDNGRMWTFEHPPIDYFSETYSFNPDQDWFDNARLSTVRLPNCSGSFVSEAGLVMTNHHCAREQITQVSRDGENLLDDGFYAETLNDERPIENYYVDKLVEIRDVTGLILDEVDAVPVEERAQVRQSAINELENELQADQDDDIVVQVVSLYNGALYSAYFFQRFDDVRLVMAPELQIGYYGGDEDNFTYPRYNLDMTFYRVYDGDDPLDTPVYFPFSDTGVEEGDAVFMIGNPGSTSRLETMTQLNYRAFYSDVYRHNLFTRVINGLEQFYEVDPEEGDERDMRNFIFSLKNAEKLYGGQIEALRDPFLMGRRADNENSFRKDLQADPELAEYYLPMMDRLNEIQAEKIEFADFNYPSLGISPNSDFSSATLQRAMFAYMYASEIENGAAAEELTPFMFQILAVEDNPVELDRNLLTERIKLFQDILGEDHSLMQDILKGRTAEEVADEIIGQSAFVTAEKTEAILENDILGSGDPAIEFAGLITPNIMEAQQFYSMLMGEEQELMNELGRAWFAVYGTQRPPDATFSPRISDGVVTGYDYNGTKAPIYTTFFGLYDRAHSHSDPLWDLPDRWSEPSSTLDLSTPVNFVSTNDIIGGNSGSPVVNISLEVVGLAFDSNIEGMGSSDFILDDRSARAVNVDSRGMLESLKHVYEAQRLVEELLNPSGD